MIVFVLALFIVHKLYNQFEALTVRTNDYV